MRKNRGLIYILFPVSLVMVLHLCALAAPDGGVSTPPADPSANATQAIQQFWDALIGHKWGLAAIIGTMLFVAFARFIAPKIHGTFGAWVNSTRVSATLALLSGMLMALATQLFQGGKLSLNLLIAGFGTGVAAIGGYNTFWDILFPADKPKKEVPLEGAEVVAKIPPPLPPSDAGKTDIFMIMNMAVMGICAIFILTLFFRKY